MSGDGAPLAITKTPLERAMFGFGAEVDQNPQRFFNAEFINGIIRQELAAGKFVGRAFISLIVLNSLTFGYVEGINYKVQLFGIQLAPVPGAGVGLCLLLGGAIFAFTTRMLDQLLIVRMRWIVVHKLVGTDLVNMATAHLNGNNVWPDLMTPRFVGYASARAHQSLGTFFNIAMLSFIGSILIASLISLIRLFWFDLQASGFSIWSTIVSSSGVLIGVVGTLNALVCVFIPFEFVRPSLDRAEPEGRVIDTLMQKGSESQ